MRRAAWGKLAALALVLAALAAAWRYTPLAELVTAERIVAWARAVRDTGWAPVAVVLAYTPAAFIMFPRPLLTLFTVIAFGAWLGFTYSMAGILGASLATYYAGRLLRPGTVERLAGGKLEHMKSRLRRHGLLAVFAIRIVPAAPFAVEGIVAGALRVRLWHYMLGTFLGMLPGVLATTVFGGQIAAALEDPSAVSYALLGALIVLAALFAWTARRWYLRTQDGS